MASPGLTLEQIGAVVGIITGVVAIIGGPVGLILIVRGLQDSTARLEKGQTELGHRLDGMQEQITSRNEAIARLEVEMRAQQKTQEQHYEQDSERFARTDRGIESLASSMQHYIGNLELRLASMERAFNSLSRVIGRRNGDHGSEQATQEGG